MHRALTGPDVLLEPLTVARDGQCATIMLPGDLYRTDAALAPVLFHLPRPGTPASTLPSHRTWWRRYGSGSEQSEQKKLTLDRICFVRHSERTEGFECTLNYVLTPWEDRMSNAPGRFEFAAGRAYCPSCHAIKRYDRWLAGMTVRCEHCGTEYEITPEPKTDRGYPTNRRVLSVARQQSKSLVPSLVCLFGVLVGLAGGFVGFLLRPGGQLIPQLPFEMVMTRGSNLKDLDSLLVPMAERSFNITIAGTVVGVLAGVLMGLLAGTLVRPNNTRH